MSSSYWFETPILLWTTVVGLQIFFLVTVGIALRHGNVLFMDLHGWSHRLTGALHLSWLVYGTFRITIHTQDCDARQAFLYDVVLGLTGLTATLSAARDFPHRHVRNKGQSGTLSSQAMVTQGEMIEHAFYQFLNLWQALFLHLMAFMSMRNNSKHNHSPTPDWQRWIALLGVTAPWYVRSRFPVNSFSQNWNNKAPASTIANNHKQKQKSDAKSSDLELTTLLYRIKKGQYLFYKHVVLHGINLAVCLQPNQLVTTVSWRIFWLCLNTAYAMEFFLQSLVRRRVLTQPAMLWLNRFLMAVSSLAAVPAILPTVRWELCILSLVLNITNRHHDVFHTMCLATAGFVLARLF